MTYPQFKEPRGCLLAKDLYLYKAWRVLGASMGMEPY